jgi:hypothetical protein
MYSISHHCRRKMRASIVVHSGSNSSIVFTKSQTVRCGGRGRCLEAHRGTVSLGCLCIAARTPRNRSTANYVLNLTAICSAHRVFMPQPSGPHRNSKLTRRTAHACHSPGSGWSSPRSSLGGIARRVLCSLPFSFAKVWSPGMVSSAAVTTFVFPFFLPAEFMHMSAHTSSF